MGNFSKLSPIQRTHYKEDFLGPAYSGPLDSIRFDWITLSNSKETSTNSKKLRIYESSRTSLTGLSVLFRNAMFFFILMNPVGYRISSRKEA